MGVILDSSILIAAERKRFDLVGFLSAHANETIFITAITAPELLHGCERANDPVIRERRTRFVEGLLQDYAALPFTLVEARTHAQLWANSNERELPSVNATFSSPPLLKPTATRLPQSIAPSLFACRVWFWKKASRLF